MTQRLRVLIVEDNATDAELLLRELVRAGFKPDSKRVDTEAEYVTNLDPALDIILSDYSMPQFSGLRALELLNERGLEIPFILVSANIGEETAVSAMRSGAADYLLKDRLARLGQAVEHALEKKRLRDERTRAEERLLEQADIINRAQDAVIIRNFADFRVTFWNAGAERLYGWTASEAIGHSIVDLISVDPNDAETFTEIIGATGEFSGEVKQRTKDGKEIIVAGRATLIKNGDGAPRSVLLINTDVTEQKKLETHLLRAQRLESIGTLASGVAHDLNNVLTPILMCSQVLRGELGDEDRQSALALIEESAQRGAAIVKQVLTFARGIEGERVLIKPSHLIQEIVDIARKTFPKSIEISGRYPDDLWSIEGDPTQLHQVLLNLSVNARDAMPNGGALVIWAENFNVDEHYVSMTPDAKAGQFVVLRVTDTGSGMSRATIDKIFDPFFTTKEVGKGTGLGLSTTLGIVKSHGGFISVYSEPGKGTTFKVFLPAAITAKDLQQSKTSVVPIQGNGELILVVDDEPNILGITKMILEKHRYDVLSASDGPEALAIFAQQMQSICLVLTDVSMPYMDGAALARALRKMKSDLPIIASTGQDEQSGMAEFQAIGVKNFLTKPYNTQQLLATIHDSLQEKAVSVV
jgi:PAS domain S-box-containing protein